MKFAIPLANGKLTAHFGHAQEFALISAENNQVQDKQVLVPPPHEPGVLPKWLADQQVDVVLAGGMGGKAIDLFSRAGIRVVTGAPVDEPEVLVAQYLNSCLETGDNACSGGGGDKEGHQCRH
jgi:predicted Fe-Mo cluster-binding NifX family protein